MLAAFTCTASMAMESEPKQIRIESADNLGTLILNPNVSDKKVEMFIIAKQRPQTCKVNEEAIPTAVLLVRTGRIALLAHYFGSAQLPVTPALVAQMASAFVNGQLTREQFVNLIGEDQARVYARDRVTEISKRDGAAERTELAFWMRSQLINLFLE